MSKVLKQFQIGSAFKNSPKPGDSIRLMRELFGWGEESSDSDNSPSVVLPKAAASSQEAVRANNDEPQAVGSDGMGSQTDTEPASTKVIQANNNDVKFSGLLNIPKRINDWFQVIDDMTKDFYGQYKRIPNELQAWGQLWASPPDGYEITTSKDRGEDCLKMPGVSNLSKKSFNDRWRKYTAKQKTE